MALVLTKIGESSKGRIRLMGYKVRVTNSGGAPTTYVVGGITIPPRDVGLSVIYGADIHSLVNASGVPKISIAHLQWDPTTGKLQWFVTGAAPGSVLDERGAVNISTSEALVEFFGV